MKLMQFWRNGRVQLGIVTPEGVVNVAAEALRRGIWAPGTMLEVICGGGTGMQVLRQLSLDARCFTEAPAAPAVTGSDKILCIGLNYRQHAIERGLSFSAAPVLFSKYPNALCADGDNIRLLPEYKEYDYEAELVAVIGKPTRNVCAEDALDYVFGYTCGNDFSTRDLQKARGGQWVMSKSFDGFAPIGPCVVTADEINPNDLRISCSVNGELRQDSNTSDMIFSVAQIIEDLSRHMTLAPGDLIFTGSPQGVIQGYPVDKRQWLRPGDQVDVTIETIGTLHNTLY